MLGALCLLPKGQLSSGLDEYPLLVDQVVVIRRPRADDAWLLCLQSLPQAPVQRPA